MKIAVQVATATMGDVVIEVSEEKNTKNIEQQQVILAELIHDVFKKIQAVYDIPTDILDLADYEKADVRYQKELAKPKPSSAEHNRKQHPGSPHHTCSHCQAEAEQELYDEKSDDSEENQDENYLDITDEELELAVALIRATREADKNTEEGV